MWRRRREGTPVALVFEGRPVTAMAGESVAAALLAADVDRFRDHPVDGSARGPFCLMGACFECLVTIEGLGERQACMVPVAEGMRIARAARSRPG